MVRSKEAYYRFSRERAIVRLKNAAKHSKSAYWRKQARLSLASMQQKTDRNWRLFSSAARKNVARIRAKNVVRRYVRGFRRRYAYRRFRAVNALYQKGYG